MWAASVSKNRIARVPSPEAEDSEEANETKKKRTHIGIIRLHKRVGRERRLTKSKSKSPSCSSGKIHRRGPGGRHHRDADPWAPNNEGKGGEREKKLPAAPVRCDVVRVRVHTQFCEKNKDQKTKTPLERPADEKEEPQFLANFRDGSLSHGVERPWELR